MSNKRYFERDADTREYTIKLDGTNYIKLPVRAFTKYSMTLLWKDVITGGTVAVLGGNSNDGPFSPAKTPDLENITLDITSGSGADYIRNMVGHVDKLLVVDFAGIVGGECILQINFTQ